MQRNKITASGTVEVYYWPAHVCQLRTSTTKTLDRAKSSSGDEAAHRSPVGQTDAHSGLHAVQNGVARQLVKQAAPTACEAAGDRSESGVDSINTKAAVHAVEASGPTREPENCIRQGARPAERKAKI